MRTLSPSRQMPSHTYEMFTTNSNPEKDLLISQLKAEIFEKEQNERNFALLQSKFRNLQNDFQLLSEAKLHLEYELRNKTDNGNKAISSLKAQNENILNELNDKLAMNKKLYNDNNNLYKTLESKNSENLSLRDQISDQERMLSQLTNDKNNMERTILNLNQSREQQGTNIKNLQDEVDRLHYKNDLQNKNLIAQVERNEQLMKELDNQIIENKNLQGKLQSKNENLNTTRRQLGNANQTIDKMEQDLNALNYTLSRCKNDACAMNNNLSKETAMRQQIEKNNERLEMMIQDRNNEIKSLNNENDSMKMSLDALNGDRQQLTDELEKYKKHILILTEQNDKLANELEEVLDRDMKLRMQLNRTERLEMVIDQNRNILENSLDNLKAGNNKNDSFMKRTYEVDNNKGIGSTLRSQNSTLAASRGFSGQ